MGDVQVPLRAEAMRLAGDWVIAELTGAPRVRELLPSPIIDFLAGLAHRGRRRHLDVRKVNLDRALAERLVAGWRHVFRWRAPELLLQLRPAPAPADGLHALAEIVADIQAALRRKRGRQDVADPLEIHELNEKAKGTHGYGQDVSSREAVMLELGISERTMYHALPLGRGLAEGLHNVKRLLPRGSDVLFVLADYDRKLAVVHAAAPSTTR
jgi:hypothetical protein